MKILHLKIPMRSGTKIKKQNNFSITPEILGQFMKFLREELGDEFHVVASPCDPSLLSSEDILYNFDMKGITKKELMELIK